ncbi:MAG: ABC transporter substrate-binding protein [Patescibacteria group bacterium]
MRKVAFVLLLVVFVFIGAVLTFSVWKKTTTPKVLKIGFQQSTGLPGHSIVLFVAKDREFFKKYHLDVELQSIPSGVSKLLVSKNVDILLTSLSTLITPAASGADVVWVGTIKTKSPSFVLFSNKKAEQIKSVATSTQGSSVYHAALAMLDFLKIKDQVTLHTISGGVNVRFASVVSGKVDAATTGESEWIVFSKQNPEKAKEFKVLVSTGKDKTSFPQDPLTVATHHNFLREHKEEVETFSKALLETVFWIKNHHEETIDTLTRYDATKEEAKIYLDFFLEGADEITFAPDRLLAEENLAILDFEPKNFKMDDFIYTDIANDLKTKGFLKQVGVN